jgi:DNA polymerase I
MVLQVHDELIFEVPEDELSIRDTVRDLMQNVVQLSVPLTVDIKQGKTWEKLG